MSEAELIALSIAGLVGVAATLIVLRWLPASVSLLVGVLAGAGVWLLP